MLIIPKHNTKSRLKTSKHTIELAYKARRCKRENGENGERRKLGENAAIRRRIESNCQDLL